MADTRASAAVSGVAGALVLLGVWQACTAYQVVSPMFLPSPATAWGALQRGLMSGDLLAQFVHTATRTLQGWAAATLIAVTLGTLIGISERARAYLLPTLAALRALPAPAVIPVAIALFGLTPTMVLAAVVFGAVWPTLLATISGLGAVEPRLIEVAGIMRLTRLAFIGKIALPTAAPHIIAGMRRSLAIALILTVACEMVAGATGLGSGILLAARTLGAGDLFAGVALLGLIGFVGNYALVLVERRALAY